VVRSHPTTFVTCKGCGKRGYESRRVAKQAMRASSKQCEGMSVYKCRLSETELWHWGHLPPPYKDGRLPRSSIGGSTRRKPERVKRTPRPKPPL
jgi:hypothetical protein